MARPSTMNLLAGFSARRYRFTITQKARDTHQWQPPPAGQKRVKESWENIWVVGMFGTLAVATVLLYYKPDSRCVDSLLPLKHLVTLSLFSVQTHALKEAKARLEARGERYKYEPSSPPSSDS